MIEDHFDDIDKAIQFFIELINTTMMHREDISFFDPKICIEVSLTNDELLVSLYTRTSIVDTKVINTKYNFDEIIDIDYLMKKIEKFLRSKYRKNFNIVTPWPNAIVIYRKHELFSD